MAGQYNNPNPYGVVDLDAIGQTTDRVAVSTSSGGILSSGRLTLSLVYLPGGVTINTISYLSGSIAMAVGSNQWFALYDKNRAKLAVTNDDTTTAWAADTVKTLTISGGFIITDPDVYYLGIMVNAVTVPALAVSQSLNAAVNTIPPIRSGFSTTGLTNPASAPATAAALTPTTTTPLGWVT